MADTAQRLLNQADAARAAAPPSAGDTFLTPTPAPDIGDAEFARMVRTGTTWQGISVRDDPTVPAQYDPYYEGTYKIVDHLYAGQELVTYDRGVYAIPRVAAYAGTFTYFAQPTQTNVAVVYPEGSFVLVGKKITPDGRTETGLYIAEGAAAGFSLRFVKATRVYLEDFERRHARAAQAYRERQAREAASSGFNFGKVLALGLGVAMIASADIPGTDKVDLGAAFSSDVMTNGKTRAMQQYIDGMNAATGGGSMFSGGMDFKSPGLNNMVAGAAGVPGATGGATAGAAAAGSGGWASTTENYNFTCPDGGSYSIPVTYKRASCGAAMKNFARVYSCNLIGDFGSAGQQCLSACGEAQCAEQ